MSKLILDGITEDDLLSKIDRVVENRILQALEKLKQQEADKLISINAACELFCPKITRQTFYAYEKLSGIARHMIGRSVFFKQSDVLNMGQRLNKIVRIEKPKSAA